MNILKTFFDKINQQKLEQQEMESRAKFVYNEAKRIWPVLTDEDKWVIRQGGLPFSLTRLFPDGNNNDVFKKIKRWVNNSYTD